MPIRLKQRREKVEKKTKGPKGRKRAAKKANRAMVMRALTEPKFRKQLESNPLKALNKKRLTAVQKKEVELVLAAVRGIGSQMNVIADKLLGACGVIV